jgi:hypothetical protein
LSFGRRIEPARQGFRAMRPSSTAALSMLERFAKMTFT